MICSFYLRVAVRKIVRAYLSLRYTSMSLGRQATNQQTNSPLTYLQCNLSVYQSAKQPTSQPVNLPTDRPTDRPTDPRIHQPPFYPPFHHQLMVDQWFNKSMAKPQSPHPVPSLVSPCCCRPRVVWTSSLHQWICWALTSGASTPRASWDNGEHHGSVVENNKGWTEARWMLVDRRSATPLQGVMGKLEGPLRCC